MNDERWVVLGLGHPRAEWFRELARWSTSAAVPVDFVKCVSPNEVRVRVAGGRPYSALLVGDTIDGADRDLIADVRAAGAAVIVVDPVADRDWTDLGAAATLTTPFDPSTLVAALTAHASRVSQASDSSEPRTTVTTTGWQGRLVAVTGSGGSGVSTVAMAVAQEFARHPSHRGMVLLADLALHAELAMLHDTHEVVPAVSELVEAHRHGRVPVARIREMTFQATEHGYHLLLGLRRHRDWTAIRPRAFGAALEGLRRSFRLVVADVDPDVEGESTTGSLDVEERNVMARATLSVADLVVVVGGADVKGLHALSRTIRELLEWGLPAERVVPCLNRTSRRARLRAEATRTISELTHAYGYGLSNPLFVPERSEVQLAIRDGHRLPDGMGRSLRTEIERRFSPRSEGEGAAVEPESTAAPQPVAPGSLGSWSEG